MASVFVCHRSIDLPAAEQLANAIQQAGHNVWLDAWEIDLGDSIIAEINRGIAGSTYLVLCLSSSGVDSPWISREWMSALARQLNGSGITILPVRLTGGSLPAILSDIRYADLATDWSKGVSELLRAIR